MLVTLEADEISSKEEIFFEKYNFLLLQTFDLSIGVFEVHLIFHIPGNSLDRFV